MRVYLAVLYLMASFVSFGQCAYDNSYFTDATPSACPGSFTVPCMYAGTYVTVSMQAGNMYTFTTCGNSSFDSQITVYDNTGTTVYGYNDDDCGLQSTVSVLATNNEVVHVLLDRYNCNNSSSSCMPLDIICDQPMTLDSSNLPIVVINTQNGASIPDTPKIDATMGIIYNGPGVRNYMTDPFNEYSGNIGIEVRGSSSQMFPKKQYSIETRDNFGNSNDITVFNMAYDNDWVLYAPYSDKSLIRNVLAYQMGWDLGDYAPRTKLCELVLNGEYRGVYVLTEKIKRKDGKVGTNDLEQWDNSGNELTGDYVLKIDKTTGGGVIAWTSPYPPYTGASQSIGFQLHDPPLDSLTTQQLNYIQNYITQFETALAGPNFDDHIAVIARVFG